MPPLPLEIILLIIGEIGLNDDMNTLRTCASVCRAFLDPCRRFLFYKISLDDENSKRRFYDVVSHNTNIASYVRELEIVDDLNYPVVTSKPFQKLSSGSTIISSMLKLFTLRSFVLRCEPGWTYWFSLSDDLQHSLMHIFRQPTLTFLRLQRIMGLSFLQLKAFMHTSFLELSNVCFTEPLRIDDELHTSAMEVRLESLTLQFMTASNSRLMINAMAASPHLRLQRLAIASNDEPNLRVAQKIMQICRNSITKLEWGPATRPYPSSFNQLDFRVLCQLRSLMIFVSFSAHQPLADLFHIVTNISEDSQISVITIEFFFERILDVVACEDTAWRSLDAILARPQFHGLRHLNLTLSPSVMETLQDHGSEEMNQSVIVLLNGLLPKSRAKGLVSVQIKA